MEAEGREGESPFYAPPRSSYERLYNFFRYAVVPENRHPELTTAPPELIELGFNSAFAGIMGFCSGATAQHKVGLRKKTALPEFTRGLPMRSEARIMAEYQLLRMQKSLRIGQHFGLRFGSACLLYYGGTLVSSVARGERSVIDCILGGSLAGLGFRAWRWRRFLSTPRYWQVMSLGHFVLTVGRSVATGSALGFAAGAADAFLCQRVPEQFRPDRTRAITQAVAEARVGEPGWDVPRHGTGEDGGLGDADAEGEGAPESLEAALGSDELEVSPVRATPSQSKVRRLGSWIKNLVWRGGGAKDAGQFQKGPPGDLTNLVAQLEASKTQ